MADESYMQSRNRKLSEQSKDVLVGVDLPNQIFAGCIFYCNGHCVPTPVELYELVVARGGQKRHYERSDVTHVLATTLNDKKKADYTKSGKKKVLLPAWVTDSIAANKRLPTVGYSLISPSGSAAMLSNFAAGVREAAPVVHGAPPVPVDSISSLRMDSTDDRFLAHYMANSRLHHMSAWKINFQDELKAQLLASLETDPLPRIDPNLPRLIAHVDMDSFFASVAVAQDPTLAGKPLVVCYNGFGEISAVSYAAKKCGVTRSMGVARAKQVCPQLLTVDFQFDAYSRVSRQVLKILCSYSRRLQVVSCDESFIDLTGIGTDVLQVAANIRAEIFAATKCCASIGIASNMLLAKMVCTSVKPDGLRYLAPEDESDFLRPLSVRKLGRVGPKIEQVLLSMNMKTIGDLVGMPLTQLKHSFGDTTGQLLWNYSRGICTKTIDPFSTRNQVGIDVNLGIRFKTYVQVMIFIEQLAEELAKRLKGRKGNTLELKYKLKKDGWEEPKYKHLGHGKATSHSKRTKRASAFGTESEISRIAKDLFRAQGIKDVTKLVGIGITIKKLQAANNVRSKSSHSAAASSEKWASSQGTMSQHVARKAAPSTSAPYRTLKRSEISKDVWDSLPLEMQRTLEAELDQQERNQGTKRLKKQRPAKARVAPCVRPGGTKRHEEAPKLHKKPSGQYRSLNEDDLDQDVLNELPPEIRAEVLRDVRKRKRAPARGNSKLKAARALPRPHQEATITQFIAAVNAPAVRQQVAVVMPSTADVQGGTGKHHLRVFPSDQGPQTMFGAQHPDEPLDEYLAAIVPHFRFPLP